MNNIKLANISHPKGIRLYTIVIDFVSMKAFSEPVYPVSFEVNLWKYC